MKFGWTIGIVVIVLLLVIGLVFYFVLPRKKQPGQPKVVNGIPTGITVDTMGNVYDANGNKIGKDNGDDTYTSNSGSLVDYNGNILSLPSNTPPVAAPGTNSGGSHVGGSTITPAGPPSVSYPVDSTGVFNWNAYFMSNAITN
jgi:hypothetical protein